MIPLSRRIKVSHAGIWAGLRCIKSWMPNMTYCDKPWQMQIQIWAQGMRESDWMWSEVVACPNLWVRGDAAIEDANRSVEQTLAGGCWGCNSTVSWNFLTQEHTCITLAWVAYKELDFNQQRHSVIGAA